MKKQIDELIKQAKNDCWEYHKDILKEQNYRKSDIGDLDLNSQDWEDVAFFEGYIYALRIIRDNLK